ncbi:MAG TPA: PH domain-containing protein [Aliidongia sp.]|uniref:PH domain-containing protein n=1 Tax=Aliidongia sp. TaxID=1914230 RepID=UPI002DDD7CD9|nr:PH domain-containing protein [Aliidongia sp.]HEV2674520.1 PH domain-containing protein [Aliidongia sp.]
MVVMDEDTVIYRARLHRLLFLRPFLWILLGLAVLAIVWVWPWLVPQILPDAPQGPLVEPWIWVPLGLGGLLLVVGLFRLVTHFARVGTTELLVTPRKVVFRSGFFSRQTIEMVNSKIETVQVDQSFLGRIFDYGTIVITGTGGSLEPVAMISHPRRLQQAIRAE